MALIIICFVLWFMLLAVVGSATSRGQSATTVIDVLEAGENALAVVFFWTMAIIIVGGLLLWGWEMYLEGNSPPPIVVWAMLIGFCALLIWVCVKINKWVQKADFNKWVLGLSKIDRFLIGITTVLIIVLILLIVH